MNKIITTFLLLANLILPITGYADNHDNPDVNADFMDAPISIIPKITNTNLRSNHDCTILMIRFEEIFFFEVDAQGTSDSEGNIARFKLALEKINDDSTTEPWGDIYQNDILGCAISTGRIKLAYMSLFIFYFMRSFVAFAGLFAVIFIIIGGYQYIMGAITQSKDAGKKTILFAIIGLVLVTCSWIIVNIVQTLVTS